LQQVVWDLLSTAVKLSRPGGSDDAQLSEGETHVVLTGTDTRAGIDPPFLPPVLERFRPAERGTTRRHRRLGLGLLIARDLVGLHGGVIEAASEGRGCGARFAVWRPRLPAAGAARAARAPVAASSAGQTPRA